MIDPDTAAEVHAVGPMQIGTHLPHLVSEDPGQRCVMCLEHNDLGTDALAGGRYLGPDEARADDDESR